MKHLTFMPKQAPDMYIRARSLLDQTKPFGQPAIPMGILNDLRLPNNEQHILRMMVRSPTSGGFKIPLELGWLGSVIGALNNIQERHNINNEFVYVTVRHGIVKSVTDDLWHVDGFSMRVPHVTEQNYIWASNHPTEMLNQHIELPRDFDPMRHNVHKYFQDVAKEENVITGEAKTLYGIDPYVVHRRPKISTGTQRTFFRISFVPIEILDDTCTINPLIPRLQPYNRGDIRDILERYPV